MFGVGAQQDMHIPGKKGPTCRQPERKFLAKGRGKGGVLVSRCEEDTPQKGTGAGPAASWAQPAPPSPGIPQHWCQTFLFPGLRGSPILELLGNLPRTGRRIETPHPETHRLSAEREGSCGPP